MSDNSIAWDTYSNLVRSLADIEPPGYSGDELSREVPVSGARVRDTARRVDDDCQVEHSAAACQEQHDDVITAHNHNNRRATLYNAQVLI